MSEFKLYAIELQNEKVFLQVSMPIYENYLFQECQVMFDFVKKNPPIKILHTLDLEDVLKVNYWVKYFMRHYGINNVRGGNYKEEILSPEQIRFLKVEIEMTFEDYENDISIFEDVLSTYQNVDLNKEENDRLENRLTEYKNKQELLAKMEIPDDLVADLEWIKEDIENTRKIYDIPINSVGGFNILSKLYSRTFLHINTNEKNRYKLILKKIQNMVTLYYELNEETIGKYCNDSYLRNRLKSFEETKVEDKVLIRKPFYTLDNFFLHPHAITSWDIQIEFANEYIDIWIGMAHSIYNWRDEIQFDLSTFPPDFEKSTRYALHLYTLEHSKPDA